MQSGRRGPFRVTLRPLALLLSPTALAQQRSAQVLTRAMQQTASSHSITLTANERPLEAHVVYLHTCSEGDQTHLKIRAPEFLARHRLGHCIPARITHLCHVRFDAGSNLAGTRLNTTAQFRNIRLANPSAHRDREHDVLAGFRQVA